MKSGGSGKSPREFGPDRPGSRPGPKATLLLDAHAEVDDSGLARGQGPDVGTQGARRSRGGSDDGGEGRTVIQSHHSDAGSRGSAVTSVIDGEGRSHIVEHHVLGSSRPGVGDRDAVTDAGAGQGVLHAGAVGAVIRGAVPIGVKGLSLVDLEVASDDGGRIGGHGRSRGSHRIGPLGGGSGNVGHVGAARNRARRSIHLHKQGGRLADVQTGVNAGSARTAHQVGKVVNNRIVGTEDTIVVAVPVDNRGETAQGVGQGQEWSMHYC